MVKLSFSKRNAKKARGRGETGLPPPPFPSRACLIFALLVLTESLAQAILGITSTRMASAWKLIGDSFSNWEKHGLSPFQLFLSLNITGREDKFRNL